MVWAIVSYRSLWPIVAQRVIIGAKTTKWFGSASPNQPLIGLVERRIAVLA
jgi:hypothetical protein